MAVELEASGVQGTRNALKGDNDRTCSVTWL